MISNFYLNEDYTIAEKFIPEKLSELFFNKTLDSHRAKLNNPLLIINELHQVLNDFHKNKIKSYEKTIRPLILETLKFLDQENVLKFEGISKTYFRKLLGEAKEKNCMLLSHACKTILNCNNHFIVTLFDKIAETVKFLNAKEVAPNELEPLNWYLNYLASELVNKGFSKSYLYSIVTRLFNKKTKNSFDNAYKEFRTACQRGEEDFIIIFKLIKLSGGSERIDIKSDYEMTDELVDEYSKINSKAKSFFSKTNNKILSYFLAIPVKGIDYISVIELAKKQIFTLIDLLHLGYPDHAFDFHKKCLVIGTRKRKLTNIQPVSYITDGNYKNNEELYNLLLGKIKKLDSLSYVQKEAKQKVISAYRHLRLGRDADELEQKFLNFWIGLEYIFSNYDISENTINRLKEYFIYAHSMAYIKRNLKEFHSDIRRLKLHNDIPGYNDNLYYLKEQNVYDYIIKKFFKSHPLLAFRSYRYKCLISCDKNIRDAIYKHKDNLDWHLTRAYRTRNEIVHDAAIHLNIESITGNLKYYLTYILNGIIEYLNNDPIDLNMDDIISIDDYFLLQELKYKSLEMSGFKLIDLLKEKSFTEIFAN